MTPASRNARRIIRTINRRAVEERRRGGGYWVQHSHTAPARWHGDKNTVNRAGKAYGFLMTYFYGWRHYGSAVVIDAIRSVIARERIFTE